MRKKNKKILILCPSPKGTAAAQRLKYEQYLPLLEDAGYSFAISNFQTARLWNIIHKPGRTFEKIFWFGIGYIKRGWDLLRAPFYDGVFVTIWATPIGPPVYEHMLRLFQKKIIYDLDDMMFMKRFDHVKQNFFQRLKGGKKPLVLLKYARYVIVCTPKLEEIALERNIYKQVVDISSTFNTDRFVPVTSYQKNEVTTIGWTGTHSSLPFLESLQPVLAEVSKLRKIKLLVIANKEYQMKDVETVNIAWKEESEVVDLQRIEIGLYPIPANEWSLGKSSLKALTYMSIGIPVVATAYGTNFRIMENGVQGFLAKDNQEWVDRIVQLIDDVELRKKMGAAGRKTVVELFSVKANFPKYLKAFNTVAPLT
ncbi:MAG: glycosyltransferase [Bacteroidetes bacterium]|nr:glycosyltransferase [Bacteroidota bacterium]MBS1930858.1 glycosyltransferase [Bacteroidota bacterium]